MVQADNMNLFSTELPFVFSEDAQVPELRNFPSFDEQGLNVMASISDMPIPGTNLGTS